MYVYTTRGTRRVHVYVACYRYNNTRVAFFATDTGSMLATVWSLSNRRCQHHARVAHVYVHDKVFVDMHTPYYILNCVATIKTKKAIVLKVYFLCIFLTLPAL